MQLPRPSAAAASLGPVPSVGSPPAAQPFIPSGYPHQAQRSRRPASPSQTITDPQKARRPGAGRSTPVRQGGGPSGSGHLGSTRLRSAGQRERRAAASTAGGNYPPCSKRLLMPNTCQIPAVNGIRPGRASSRTGLETVRFAFDGSTPSPATLAKTIHRPGETRRGGSFGLMRCMRSHAIVYGLLWANMRPSRSPLGVACERFGAWMTAGPRPGHSSSVILLSSSSPATDRLGSSLLTACATSSLLGLAGSGW